MEFIPYRAIKVNAKAGFVSLDPQLSRRGSVACTMTSLGGRFYRSWSLGRMGHISQQQLLAEGFGVNHSKSSGMLQSVFPWAWVMHNWINQPKMEKPNISQHDENRLYKWAVRQPPLFPCLSQRIHLSQTQDEEASRRGYRHDVWTRGDLQLLSAFQVLASGDSGQVIWVTVMTLRATSYWILKRQALCYIYICVCLVFSQ